VLSSPHYEACLTSEEVALCFYKEMKSRIIAFLPAVGGIIADAMIKSNAENLTQTVECENLGYKIEMNFKTLKIKAREKESGLNPLF